jgi:hypothetical protein
MNGRLIKKEVLMGQEFMDVICLVLPSGQTIWLDAEEVDEVDVNKLVREWFSKNSVYRNTPCSLSAVKITMPKDKYLSVAFKTSSDFVPPQFDVVH